MYNKQPAWGNAAGARGRRIIEDESVDKAYYDPEDRRQRRLGMGQAGLGLAGAAGVAEGGRRIMRDSKEIAGVVLHPRTDKAGKVIPRGQPKKPPTGKVSRLPRALRLRKKPVAMLTGGAAALSSAKGVRDFAESETGRKWD